MSSPPSHRRPAPRLWRRLAVLLLLLAVPACAAPGALPPAGAGTAEAAPRKPGAALRHAADIAGPACAAEHRALIEEARAVARQRLAAAIALVQQSPDHAHLRRWFGTAPPQEVGLRLQRTADWLGEPERFKLLCNDPPACRGPRMAYAAPSRRIVGLCPAFFRARMEGFDNRWGVLIHEASHLAAGTDDHAYGVTAALILAKQDPRRAAQNADNFEYFVESLPR